VDAPLTGARAWLYFSNSNSREITEVKKTMKPFDLVQEQYQFLMAKFTTTRDVQEKNVLFKRLTNLLAVMEFLLSLNKTQ